MNEFTREWHYLWAYGTGRDQMLIVLLMLLGLALVLLAVRESLARRK